jgi:hypothetical protein
MERAESAWIGVKRQHVLLPLRILLFSRHCSSLWFGLPIPAPAGQLQTTACKQNTVLV